jgi:hypothetical protein
MDKEYLIKSAEKLNQVSEKTANEYQNKRDILISKINEIMLSRPDLESLIGIENINMMKDNHANHVRFISSIIKNFEPEILVETVLWVFRAYRSHGFSTNYWASQLNSWIEILKTHLSDNAYNEILPFYEWMQVNIPLFAKLSDDELDKNLSQHKT